MSNLPFRPFDHKKDIEAIQRIWIEIGWIEDKKEELATTSLIFKQGHTEVATIDDRAECSVNWVPAKVRYLDSMLPMGAVMAVTTSHLARKLGFARDLTARALAAQAKAGMAVSALGMFDQGFYDKVGFGSGPYINEVQFDAATLKVDSPFRPPKRLSADDYAEVHKALANRKPFHGAVVLSQPEVVKADMLFTEKPFGLGYFDGLGRSLSHFIWGEMKGEHGPYRILARAYQSTNQLMELLALIKSLGDQVSSFIIDEFGEFQFQDLLRTPFRNARASRGGAHAQKFTAYAEWQIRILDLAACLAATRSRMDLSFNLSLTDPLTDLLTDEDGWRGIAGDYTVRLGASGGTLAPGHNPVLPTLAASVNAFSRMWFGIRPATHLEVTDDLVGHPSSLIYQLDAALKLPVPDFGWRF